MATKTKHEHISHWNTAGVGALLAGGPLAAGELEAHAHTKNAKAFENNASFWRQEASRQRSKASSGEAPHFGQTTSTGYEASHNDGDAAHHARMADTYRQWARKQGTPYPYVTQKLRNEASQRAYEHDKAAGGGRSSGYSGGTRSDWEDPFTRRGPGSSRSRSQWEDIYEDLRRKARGHYTSESASEHAEGRARTSGLRAQSYRRAANEARVLGRVGAGVGLGVTGLYGAAVMHNNKKWREEQHRRNKGKFAPTGAVKKNDTQESAVENNLSVEEIFSKARQMEHSHWAGAKHGAKIGAKVGGVLNGATGAVTGAGMGAATHGAAGAATGALVGGAAGTVGGVVQGGALGGLVGAAVGKDVPKKRVKKSYEPTVEDLFAAARGDEIAKGLFTEAGKIASNMGGAAKTGFNRAGGGVAGAVRGVKGGAKSGFNAAKPKVTAAAGAAKDKFNSQPLGRRYAAVGAAGVAGGVGLGAAAQSNKQPKPAF